MWLKKSNLIILLVISICIGILISLFWVRLISDKFSNPQVNIECDIFARYIYHQLNFDGTSETGKFSFKDKEKNKNILSLLEDNEF